ncbi:Crp/Fnr family transcriptional regulator [Mucilaginibacter sp. 21P]|uniref:Crp/Fnr family transcriptional regulator n=1 Tax=Mucilaginibacter sp. 21P TaxID=2778902 RepID=UPI001C56429C|nr:Crp/Fnr family transcriptional regulator [Mucilaginibacter sp. 21P]
MKRPEVLPITDDHLLQFRKEIDNWVVFSDQEWEILNGHVRLIKIKRKGHFARVGSVCAHLGFLISGSVRLFHIKDGVEITAYVTLPNEFVSSYKSFIRQELGQLGIQALEDSLVAVFDRQNWEKLLDHPVTAHKTERLGRLITEKLVFCYEDRLEAFITKTPAERYEAMLSCRPEMTQNIPQRYLANYLGITPTSLSRIRKRITRSGKL